MPLDPRIAAAKARKAQAVAERTGLLAMIEETRKQVETVAAQNAAAVAADARRAERRNQKLQKAVDATKAHVDAVAAHARKPR